MLLGLILLFSLAAAAADWLHFRRARRARLRRLSLAWAAATDALPLAVVGMGLLCRDNPTPVVMASMWLFWVWMATVLLVWPSTPSTSSDYAARVSPPQPRCSPRS